MSMMSLPLRLHRHRFQVSGQRFKGTMRELLQARLSQSVTLRPALSAEANFTTSHLE